MLLNGLATCAIPPGNRLQEPGGKRQEPVQYVLTRGDHFNDRINLHLLLMAILQSQNQQETDMAKPDAEFLAKYPIALARRQRVLGLEREGDTMPVAVADQSQQQTLDIIARIFRCQVRPVVQSEQVLLNAINRSYQLQESQTHRNIQALEVDEEILRIGQPQREDLLDQTGRPAVIRLVNSILFDAVQERASDIHIQPFEDKLQVRFRIDGVLFDQFEIPKASQEEVLSRVKIIGKMNIAEKRLPQDGRATAEIGSRLIDLRIASLPTSHGERIVIRLLDKSARMYTLDELGMSRDILRKFQHLIRLEHGLILVTGPTGGGKSTTLYAALQEINTNSSNVVTLEDPIEYQLHGISQTQVSEKKGMTFASGLRNVLRQDPDIIMIGEIRDRETAEMAIQSALTGHMVFSTLHTNDAASSVTRLLDLGIEPYLVASSVLGVLSQRLVRKICESCRSKVRAVDVSPDWDHQTAFVGAGCDRCRETGYRGRIGLFELMVISDEIRDCIQARANASEIRSKAIAHGMNLLREDGLRKIERGLTSISEVQRVSMALTCSD